MGIRHFPLFAAVAVLWGIPYLLIAVALTGFETTFVVWARVALAAVVLVSVVGPRALARSLHGRLLAVGGFALVQFVVPLALIALIACMRKLLTAIYSVAKHRRPFVPILPPPQAAP